MLRHAAVLARQVIQARRLGPDSLVIEAGCNDGWLLQYYREAGVPVLGLETDPTAARLARQRHGIPTREATLSRQLADRLVSQGLQADVLHAHCSLHQATDHNSFAGGIRRLLKPNGLAVIETPYVKDVLDAGALESLTTQQQSCVSLTALSHSFTGLGLLIVEVGRVPVHGGLLQVLVTPAHPEAWPGESVIALLLAEEQWGVRSLESYAAVARKAA
jgi:SAM-dependent methyltransferase